MKALESKIPPPLVVVVFGLLMWGLASITPRTDIGMPFRAIMVSVFLVLGLLFALSGIVSFRMARTTINPHRPQKATALVITGVYKITRNPMYVGLACVLVGWCAYLGAPVALAGVVGFVLYITGYQILPEERALTELFGDEYRLYQARVRRWL